MQNRKLYIDLEKSILVINVLLIHQLFIYGDNVFLRVLHRLCIPQFALLCGYNMNFNIDKPLLKNWIKTISYIFFIYFWSLIFTYLVFENTFDVKNSIILILQGMFHPRYNMPIWYAPYYIVLYTISIIVFKFTNLVSLLIGKLIGRDNYYSYELLLVLSILFACLGFTYEGYNQFFAKQALITMPHVILGNLLYRFDRFFDILYIKTSKKEKIVLSSFIILLLIIFSLIFYELSNIGGVVDIAPFIIDNIPNFYITTILGGICLFVICKLLCSINLLKYMITVISYIGTKSMFICCFHQIIQNITFEYYAAYLSSFNNNIFLSLFNKILLTILTTIVLSFAIDKEKYV